MTRATPLVGVAAFGEATSPNAASVDFLESTWLHDSGRSRGPDLQRGDACAADGWRQVPRVVPQRETIDVQITGRHRGPQGHQVVAGVEHSAQFAATGREGPVGMFGQKQQ